MIRFRKFLAFFGLALAKDLRQMTFERNEEVALKNAALQMAAEAQPLWDSAVAARETLRRDTEVFDKEIAALRSQNSFMRVLLGQSLRRGSVGELEAQRIEKDVESAIQMPRPTGREVHS